MPVPDGVDKIQLQAAFLAELKATSAGAKNAPIEKPIGTKKAPPPHRSRGLRPTQREGLPPLLKPQQIAAKKAFNHRRYGHRSDYSADDIPA
jgi:hypothetical protein